MNKLAKANNKNIKIFDALTIKNIGKEKNKDLND